MTQPRRLNEFLDTPALINEPLISGLTLDSRQVKPGDLFFACRGHQTHGERFIPMALERGAVAVLKETDETGVETLDNNVPCIHVPNLSQRLGEIAARFHHYPTRQMHVIGVTGSNGKTSITHYIAQLLSRRASCAVLGTLGIGVFGEPLTETANTTPDAIQLQNLFADLQQRNVQHAVMEVSSHALEQGRVNAIEFDTAIFTNLTQDHLDYHKTMEAYGQAKRRLFEWPNLKHRVINQDDNFGHQLIADFPQAVGYSLLDQKATVVGQVVDATPQGCQLELRTPWGDGEIALPLPGNFNASNALAALAGVCLSGVTFDEALNGLTELQSAPGRLEKFTCPNGATVFVDYAHTPDALEKSLTTLRAHCQGRMLCVFGCGGDRDKTKRPLMGQIVEREANVVVITDDNPRHEPSQAIIDDILVGLAKPANAVVIPDRRAAIKYAIREAQPNDIVLVAGKGHEDYQQIGDEKLPFSDREVVESCLTG